MNHLSDEDLQKYLDKDSELNRGEIDRHLRSCGHCRQNYLIYKQLYAGLADETGFMLSVDFAESVVSRIRKRREKTYSFFEGVLMSIAGLVSVGLVFYFTNFGEIFQDIFNKNVEEIKPLIKGIADISGGNLTIYIFAVVILILFGVADKLIFQTKHR